MKILLVGNYFPPWRGGVETYVYNLAIQLQKRGHEATVLCANAPVRAGDQFLNGIKIERLRMVGRIYGTPLILALPHRLAHETADIIHANFPSPYGAYFASMTSRLRRIPSILTWHNDLPPVTPMARALVLTHNRLVLPHYLCQFSFIVATTEVYAKASPTLRAESDRVVVIPHGVDTQRFHPDISGGEIWSRFQLAGSKVVLFVGALTRWHRYKGLDILIKAMALMKNQLPRTKLLIVGGGELATEYATLATDLGAGDCVIFAGDVPDDELPKYYAASDIFVIPSKDRSEGFGLTILEANSAGKPAIGTNVGGIPGVIQDGYNGALVPPNNAQALAEVIKKLLSDEDALKQMGKNGRALAEQHDWSTPGMQTEDLYKRALQ